MICEHCRPHEQALIGGPYRTPHVRRGDWVEDEVLGLVEVGGLTDAPIPWPYRKRPGKRSLILFGDLAAAVRVESVKAIVALWGVTDATVWRWRKALGVDERNAGTTALHRALAPTKLTPDVSARGREAAQQPEVRARARAKLIGRTLSPEHRAAVTEAARRPRSWTREHLSLLGTCTDDLLAEISGHTVKAVSSARERAGRRKYSADSVNEAISTIIDAAGQRHDVRKWFPTGHGFSIPFGKSQGAHGHEKYILTAPLVHHLRMHGHGASCLPFPASRVALWRAMVDAPARKPNGWYEHPRVQAVADSGISADEFARVFRISRPSAYRVLRLLGRPASEQATPEAPPNPKRPGRARTEDEQRQVDEWVVRMVEEFGRGVL